MYLWGVLDEVLDSRNYIHELQKNAVCLHIPDYHLQICASLDNVFRDR